MMNLEFSKVTSEKARNTSARVQSIDTRDLVLTFGFDQSRDGTLCQVVLKSLNSRKIRIFGKGVREATASTGADDNSDIVHRVEFLLVHQPVSDDCRVIVGKEPFCVFWRVPVS